jgi:hypothetical protein
MPWRADPQPGPASHARDRRGVNSFGESTGQNDDMIAECEKAEADTSTGRSRLGGRQGPLH